MSLTLGERLARSENGLAIAMERLLLEARCLAEAAVDTRRGRRSRTDRTEQMERIATRMARHLRDMGCTCLDRRTDELGEDITPDCPVHVVPF